MPTCRDCIYVEACYALNKEIKKHPKDFLETDLCAKQCKTFKARADFLEADRILHTLDRLKSLGPLSSVFDKLEKWADKCRIPPATNSDLEKGRE